METYFNWVINVCSLNFKCGSVNFNYWFCQHVYSNYTHSDNTLKSLFSCHQADIDILQNYKHITVSHQQPTYTKCAQFNTRTKICLLPSTLQMLVNYIPHMKQKSKNRSSFFFV